MQFEQRAFQSRDDFVRVCFCSAWQEETLGIVILIACWWVTVMGFMVTSWQMYLVHGMDGM